MHVKCIIISLQTCKKPNLKKRGNYITRFMHRSEACVGGVAAVLMREVALTDIN